MIGSSRRNSPATNGFGMKSKKAMRERQGRGRYAGGAAGALGVTDHRLGGRARHAVGGRPERGAGAARPDGVGRAGQPVESTWLMPRRPSEMETSLDTMPQIPSAIAYGVTCRPPRVKKSSYCRTDVDAASARADDDPCARCPNGRPASFQASRRRERRSRPRASSALDRRATPVRSRRPAPRFRRAARAPPPPRGTGTPRRRRR